MNRVVKNRILEVLGLKKISILLSILFLSILLAGCISIPLGDGGKLGVSKDGVNVDLGEEEAEAEENIDEIAEEDVEGTEDETNGEDSLVGAYVFTVAIKRALVDPIVTIAMVRTYQQSISGLEPTMDLQQKLLGVSSRFRKLFEKGKEADAGVAPAETKPVEVPT